MPKASPIQESFSRGIQSTLLDGNIQYEARGRSYQDSQNLIPLKQGPVVRRGGTKFVSEVKTSADNTSLVRFRRNPAEAYIIEQGDMYTRFYKNNAPVTEDTQSITDISTNVYTVTGHNYSDDDHVIIRLSDDDDINGRQLVIDNATANTFTLTDILGTAITPTDDASPSATVEKVYELSSLYRKEDLYYPSGYDRNESPALDFVQSVDTLYITHPNEFSQTLKRNEGDTSWSYAILNFKDGPYLPIDDSGITMTLGATSGTTSLTASSDIFKYTDYIGINRRIRFNDSVTTPAWSWATITDYTSPTVVEVTFQDGTTVADTTPEQFRLGLFYDGGAFIPGESQYTITGISTANPCVVTVSETHDIIAGDYVYIDGISGGMVLTPGSGRPEIDENTFLVASATSTTITLDQLDGTDLDTSSNYTAWSAGGKIGVAWLNRPRNIALYEDRFCFSGTIDNPERIDMTITGGYSDTQLRFDPTAIDGTVNPSDGITSVLGGSELNYINWMRATDRGLAVGTTGSEGMVQSTTRGEGLTPANQSYKQQTTLGSAFAKPMALSGAILFIQRAARRLHEFGYNFEADRFKSPDMTALAEHLTRGGIKETAWQQEPNNILWVLLADGELLGFTYDRDENTIAWHKHALGGTDVVIKSIQVIPSSDSSRDELWLLVERTIDGNTVQYIEYMDRHYEDDIALEDAYTMDCGRSYSGDTFAISGATAADPVVLTTATHDLAVDDYVRVTGVVGMTELNNFTYKITAVTSTTMTLANLNGTDLDGSAYTAYSSGGTSQHSMTTITDLHHLEGEVVSFLVDGKITTDQTVTSGAVTLANNANGVKIQVGLNKPWYLQTLRLEAGAADGTSQGKIKSISKLGIRVKDTLGLKYGPDASNQDEYNFGYGQSVSTATPLFSGDIDAVEFPGIHDKEGRIYLSGDTVYPAQIQAIMPQVHTQDNR